MSKIIADLNRIEQRAKTDRVSAKYAHVSTAELIRNLADAGVINLESGKLFSPNRGQSTYHQVSFELGRGLITESLIGGDRVKPTLNIFNSFNGQGALGIYLGLYRLVCSNGLVIGSGLFEAKCIHVEGPKIRGALERLTRTAADAVSENSLQRILTAVDRLDGERCNRTDIERILDEMTLPYRTYHRALAAYERPHRRADSGDSAWLAYNRVQEVIADPKRGQAGIQNNRRLMQEFLEHFEVRQPIQLTLVSA